VNRVAGNELGVSRSNVWFREFVMLRLATETAGKLSVWMSEAMGCGLRLTSSLIAQVDRTLVRPAGDVAHAGRTGRTTLTRSTINMAGVVCCCFQFNASTDPPRARVSCAAALQACRNRQGCVGQDSCRCVYRRAMFYSSVECIVYEIVPEDRGWQRWGCPDPRVYAPAGRIVGESGVRAAPTSDRTTGRAAGGTAGEMHRCDGRRGAGRRRGWCRTARWEMFVKTEECDQVVSLHHFPKHESSRGNPKRDRRNNLGSTTSLSMWG
jgi:hypothetical protein